MMTKLVALILAVAGVAAVSAAVLDTAPAAPAPYVVAAGDQPVPVGAPVELSAKCAAVVAPARQIRAAYPYRADVPADERQRMDTALAALVDACGPEVADVVVATEFAAWAGAIPPTWSAPVPAAVTPACATALGPARLRLAAIITAKRLSPTDADKVNAATGKASEACTGAEIAVFADREVMPTYRLVGAAPLDATGRTEPVVR